MNALKAANQPIPTAQRIRALVDTGASGTCIDPSVLQALSITPTGVVQVCTPSTGNQPHSANQYDIGIVIPAATNQIPFFLPTIAVIESTLLPQGIHALIGRDVLKQCLFSYNGQSGFFTFAY